jgi:hypothetical protein
MRPYRSWDGPHNAACAQWRTWHGGSYGYHALCRRIGLGQHPSLSSARSGGVQQSSRDRMRARQRWRVSVILLQVWLREPTVNRPRLTRDCVSSVRGSTWDEVAGSTRRGDGVLGCALPVRVQPVRLCLHLVFGPAQESGHLPDRHPVPKSVIQEEKICLQPRLARACCF